MLSGSIKVILVKKSQHALLKSELHSNGFINCRAVLDYPALCMLMANEMLKVIEYTMQYKQDQLKSIDFIACSAYSAIDLGFCLSYLISQTYNNKVKHIIAEKDSEGNPTIIRGGINPELKGIVINELMTTAA